MKRIFLLIILCGIALSWGISHAGIAGTRHDLSAANPTPGPGGFSFYGTLQVCVFCHTPHGARTDINISTFWNGTAMVNNSPGSGSMLLWNRALSGPDTGLTGFELYTSPTYNSYSGQLNVYTLMCLGCHDGVGALNVVQNYPNDIPDPVNGPIPDVFNFPTIETIGEARPPGGAGNTPNIGDLDFNSAPGDTTLHLANDHPVSIDYATASTVTDVGAFRTLSTNPDGTAFVYDTRVRLFPDPNSPTNYRFIECSTCHDVHNNSSGYEPFLVMPNTASSLCVSCHIK